MKNFPGHISWITNSSYAIYAIREITAIPLAFYGLYLLVQTYVDWQAKYNLYVIPNSSEIINLLAPFNSIIQYFGITVAIIHSLTWFYVLPKILPFSQTIQREKILAIITIALWITFSYLIFTSFYK